MEKPVFADSLLELDSGFNSTTQDQLSHVCSRKRPLSALSISQLKVPQFLHLPPRLPGTLDGHAHGKGPGIGELGSKGPQACPSGSQLPQPRASCSVEWQILLGGRQTTLCPTGTDPPCHRLPKGAPSPYPTPPGAAIKTPRQSSISALATLGPPAGPPSPALTAPAPAQAAQ